MTRRYLEITKATAKRAGFYKMLPPNPIQWQVNKWYLKEGEVIKGTPDPNTGTVVGELILNLESTEKGSVDIEAIEWEIGARIVKILIPEETPIDIDLNHETLRLAELETETEAVVKSETQKPESGKTEKPKAQIRVTPLAAEAVKELNVSLEDVIAWIPADITELTLEHVRAFAAKKSSVKAAPKVRQRAKELGVDLDSVPGSGPDGIILLQDLEPKTISDDAGAFEILKPTMRRKGTARHMTEAWHAPHAGPGIDINPVPLLTLREEMKESFERMHGVKLRIDHFFIAACAWLLKQNDFRVLNGYWHEEKEGEHIREELRLYSHVNIGIAVAIPAEKTHSGRSELVVPSVKLAEMLRFTDIVKEAERLVSEASSGNPKTEDLLDTTFIVNNTGAPVRLSSGKVVPGAEFMDSIFAPNTSAILAFGAARDENGVKKMRLSLKFDHRVCDGREPTHFVRELQELIEHPEQILVLI